MKLKMKHLVNKTHRVIDQQNEKIKLDQLRLDLQAEKDGDFEYQINFEKSFYGHENVKLLNQDRFVMRNKIVECLGKQQAKKGISGKSALFWISKKKPFSKEFIKKFPNVSLQSN